MFLVDYVESTKLSVACAFYQSNHSNRLISVTFCKIDNLLLMAKGIVWLKLQICLTKYDMFNKHSLMVICCSSETYVYYGVFVESIGLISTYACY